MEGSYQRLRGAIRGGSKLSEVEGSNQDALRGGEKQSEVEGSIQRWREAIRGGGGQSKVQWR